MLKRWFAAATLWSAVTAVGAAHEVTRSSDGASPVARCSLRHDRDGWWLVTPSGERFFSLGVSVVTQGTSPDDYDPARPSYAAWRHYATPREWADANLQRLKSWGFTTVGGWGDLAALNESDEHDLWLMPVAHLGSHAGAPWWDMWDEKNLARMRRLAQERIAPLRADPRVIGYYSDNEIGWWCGKLWTMTLEQPATSGQRQRLVALLREIYGDDWSKLVVDFEPEGAANWDELAERGMLWHRPGSNGIRTIRRFLALVADRYYRLMDELITHYDPHGLFLGDRYQSFYYPEVAHASRPYVDVISTNLNVAWNDGTHLRSYLDTLYAITGKPIVVSEFYMAAMENRSGNRNASSGFPTVATQAERARALLNTLQFVSSLPYVVGAEWFQHHDEPPHGRPQDGEDFNFGLVDIHDEPYEGVTAAFATADPVQWKTIGKPRPDASAGAPPATADPFAEMKFMTALKHWDRERGYVKPTSEHPTGDLYLCWSPEAVYLGVYVLDAIDSAIYRDARVPEADRAVWTVRVDDAAPVVARVGGGARATVNDAAVRVESLGGVNHDLRAIAIMKIPAARLGRERLAAGDEIELDVSYVTHGRAHRIEWRGTIPLVR